MHTAPVEQSKATRRRRLEAALGMGDVSRLSGRTVAVIGLGALGGPVVQHLAMLGIGRIILADPDTVGPENQGNQLVGPADVGLAKVEARRRMIARLNPGIRVTAYRRRLESLGLGVWRDCDLVFVCTDSLASRVAANRRFSQMLGIPWVNAATDGGGGRMFGKVGSFGGGAEAACYTCAHGEEALAPYLKGAKAGCPTWWGLREGEQTLPTLSASPEAAVVAGLQVQQGLRRLLGADTPSASRELLIDLDDGSLRPVGLRKNRRCMHDPLGALEVLGDRDSLTLGKTFEVAEQACGAPARLRLHGRRFITRIPCVACGRETPVGRVDSALQADTLRCACGRRLTPSPFSHEDALSRAAAAEFLDRTWPMAGLPADDVVSAEGPRGTRHFVLAQNGRNS